MKSDITIRYENSSPSQEELINGCRRGDQRAQLKVYKLFCKPVYGICLQIADNPMAAENLMHESFLLAFENINEYRGDIQFQLWLGKFIKNAVCNGNI